MADPYPEITSWTIPREAVAATLNVVDSSQHPGVEAGALWLGPRQADAMVNAVVFPRGEGVENLPGCWRVTPEVFGQIATWATNLQLSLLAVCHTHGGPSPGRLSRRDRTHSIKAPGVLAVVIGRNGDEPAPDRGGWYVWQDGDYRLLTARSRSRRLRFGGNGPSVWSADARGIYPA